MAHGRCLLGAGQPAEEPGLGSHQSYKIDLSVDPVLPAGARQQCRRKAFSNAVRLRQQPSVAGVLQDAAYRG